MFPGALRRIDSLSPRTLRLEAGSNRPPQQYPVIGPWALNRVGGPIDSQAVGRAAGPPVRPRCRSRSGLGTAGPEEAPARPCEPAAGARRGLLGPRPPPVRPRRQSALTWRTPPGEIAGRLGLDGGGAAGPVRRRQRAPAAAPDPDLVGERSSTTVQTVVVPRRLGLGRGGVGGSGGLRPRSLPAGSSTVSTPGSRPAASSPIRPTSTGCWSG